MKLIDVRTGSTLTLPITLGERGRGRWLEEVSVARQPDRAPASAEDVGYFTIPVPLDRRKHDYCPERHVVLTRARPDQTGVLVRINTSGTYTRNSCGSITLLFGDAEELTSGRWAEGDAGRIGHGPDALWHVRGPALLRVVIQGGRAKGYGARWLTVTTDLRVRLWEPADLVRSLATGDDAAVEQLCRAALGAGVLPEDLSQALATLDAIEESPAAPASSGAHYWQSWAADASLTEALEHDGLAVPAGWTPDQGVAGVQSGTLVPGDRTLVRYGLHSGGGKRWSLRDFATQGLEQIHPDVYAILSDDWAITGTQYRDGEPHTYWWIDASGVHTLAEDDAATMPIAWHGRPQPTHMSAVEMLRKRAELLSIG